MELSDEYVTKIACRIIEQAYLDVRCEKDFESSSCQRDQDFYRTSASTFFRGEFFKTICEALGFDDSAIRLRAFK
jgi:hypothetical protein